ncbi:MAG: hypothetical protein HFE51_09210 [Clostridia bacterium]|nr:hypothetical protein [Clostridia bacterium]
MKQVKRKNKLISLSVIMILLFSILCYSFSVKGENLSFDFENQTYDWDNLYGGSQSEYVTEENGNTYLKLTFVEGGERKYFDISAASHLYIGNSKRIQVNYDVMYPEFTEARDGEMHIKNRIGPGSAETTMVARVAQVNGYFQVQGGEGQGFQR